MQKKYSLKKQLNNSLLKKKVKINAFALILENSTNIKKLCNKNFFTRNALNNDYLARVSKLIKLHPPLNFYFFKRFKNCSLFIVNYIKYVNTIKIKNKFFKKLWVKNFIFSKTQTFFFNLNCFLFF